MPDIQIEFENLRDFIETMRKAPPRYRRAFDVLLGRNAGRIAGEASRRAPMRTGRLRSSIRARRSGELQYEVDSSAPYAGYVEKGTRPHVILPVRAKALRFRVGSQEIFAKRVEHPGTNPQAFFGPAVESALPKLREELAQAFQDVFRKKVEFVK